MKRIIYNISALAMLLSMTGCNSFLDIVPDNIATMDHAFALRQTAERALATCYSYLPKEGDHNGNFAMTAGDEVWFPISYNNSIYGWQQARGFQSVDDVLGNFWQGEKGGVDCFEAIRACDQLIDNIYKVPDMDEDEKVRWVAEAKVLKAYYHFLLMRSYGPIPIVHHSVPVDAYGEDSYPFRRPIDEVAEFIYKLCDEAIPDLPDIITETNTELGRITTVIARCVKVQAAMLVASPLFNGNTDYAGFDNGKGEQLVSQEYSAEKWETAAQYCLEAIQAAEEQQFVLYKFRPTFFQYEISDDIQTQLDIRCSFTEDCNSEVLWPQTNSLVGDMQQFCTPRGVIAATADKNYQTAGIYAPTMKMVELYYSKNGVPIDEDKEYDYANRFKVEMPGQETKYLLIPDYPTAKININREPRFYAHLGFDGGMWYGYGHYDINDYDNWPNVQAKLGQPCAAINMDRYSVTGYTVKKYAHYEGSIPNSNTAYQVTPYCWPMMRLTDLYLYYAEALNEANDTPTDEVYEYIDRVRNRAGLMGVKESWEGFSKNPSKYKSKEGMREIIQHERLIEFAFEGKRYWDLLRWKRALEEYNKRIIGWDINQWDAESYYRPKVLFNQTFSLRDYLTPIKQVEMLRNENLVQNPGW